MKRIDLRTMSVDQLVERFTEICLAQDDALHNERPAQYNRLYDRTIEVTDELRARGPEARLALVNLFDHPNAQVRLRAAAQSLAVVPERARRVLEVMQQAKEFPQAGSAGMILWSLDDGTFARTR